MLHRSFLHIPSIGPATERRIWNSGIRSMDDFLASPPRFLNPTKRAKIADHVHLAKDRLHGKDAAYFYTHLPPKEHWRMFNEYQDTTAYVDIETTGLGSPADMITTIALYDGRNIKYYINGKNLNAFPEDIRQYKMMVSYNGKTFDVPFIERYFGIHLSVPHLDLRYILHGLGFSGGLKACERQLGIGRTGSLADVDGFFAVLLWNDYKTTGNEESLETLLSYNIEDVLNLEYLMAEAYNRKLREIPFAVDDLPVPDKPANPFPVHASVVERLQYHYYRYQSC